MSFAHSRIVPEGFWNYDKHEKLRSKLFLKDGDKWIGHEYNNSQLSAIVDLVNRYVVAAVARNRFTYRKDREANGYIYAYSNPNVPPTKTIPIKESTTNNNGKAWRKAKSDPKIIVVSGCQKISGECSAVPVLESVGNGVVWDHVFVSHLHLISAGLATAHPELEGASIFGGAARFHVLVPYKEFRGSKWNVIEPRFIVQDLLLQYKRTLLVDDALVTSTVADADVACMDVLTAVAELPQTARSVIDGLKTVSDMASAVKKREFALSKAFAKRKEDISRRHQRSNSQLKEDLANAKSPKRKEYLRKQISRNNRSYQKALRDTAVELADAISNVYLNWRYNIMPNVYMIQDLVDLYSSWSATYKTSRKKKEVEYVFEYGNRRYETTTVHRCMIKRLLDPNLRFSSLTSANVLHTGYQLIPWTFMLDWFVNAGDIIVASTSPSYALSEGSTYSYKTEFNISWPDIGFKCNMKAYTCEVITPSNHIGLGLQFDLSKYQKLDLLAFAWRPIRDTLISSKRK